jgi:putative oxidoreductase
MSHDIANDMTVDKTASGKRSYGYTETRGRWVNRLLWALQIVVGLDFLVGAFMKLSSMPHMIVLFDDIGAGQWLRYFVGCCELAGGIGLLIKPIAGLAALGLAALMVGALYTNVVLIDESLAPLWWLILVSIIAWGRWPRTKALFASLKPSRP